MNEIENVTPFPDDIMDGEKCIEKDTANKHIFESQVHYLLTR